MARNKMTRKQCRFCREEVGQLFYDWLVDLRHNWGWPSWFHRSTLRIAPIEEILHRIHAASGEIITLSNLGRGRIREALEEAGYMYQENSDNERKLRQIAKLAGEISRIVAEISLPSELSTRFSRQAYLKAKHAWQFRKHKPFPMLDKDQEKGGGDHDR